ncbi:DUF459 domain-containing protein [Acidicapsa dinghuensis]|uniref:DUF459 domain-containing protein n=1 Tax=Acidicapsa dinghuensis TaxID=2218256 RepID=A0ABW1EG10_9BACT|nr:DUF459 domain-containing protein [Acidicapsa dinghuensis]
MRIFRHNSLLQLATAACGFAFTMVLLDSEGLKQWALQLEVSQTSLIAVQLTSRLRQMLAPLGVSAMRQEALAALNRVGWSDDPAQFASAQASLLVNSPHNGNSSAKVPTPETLALTTTAHPSVTRGSIIDDVPQHVSLTPLPQLMTGQRRAMALVGDSMMAVALSDILLRQTAGNSNLQVIRAYRSGTGLARPDVFNWMQEYHAMIADQEPNAIYVAIGANDGQGFVENGTVLAFGTPAWIAVYEERTTAFLNLLTAHGAHVVWIGLPPMKSGIYNAKIAQINRIAYSVVSRNPLAVWWNPATYIGDATGAYRDFGQTSDSRTVRLRAQDGIHLSDDGAALLAPALLRWLNTPKPDAAQIAPTESLGSPKEEHATGLR